MLLVICHVSLVFTLNVIEEVAIWSSVNERDVRLYEQIPLSFWMLRAEDKALIHVKYD